MERKKRKTIMKEINIWIRRNFSNRISATLKPETKTQPNMIEIHDY